ncbi:Methylcrotonyl-CoA carboxylase biotin-containing subunit [Rhodovulum sp. P5]|uniref:biotin/lipoyl-containing protein n=1 Tax=Rhodovulum sp. P5 TaxID=1564506 RepID=UPI0009C240FC|nr:acetyl-CoA carboxylase biotin carboxyl carrier protein subunit [Rhodovulum sp. P5]ARE39193.1 Methylcrotonyl-CoA carboxylase biotin-containing subunit [Rhodovulum sp. P5]
MMKRLRITVEGIAYDVTVEDLDSPAAPAPAPKVAAAPQSRPAMAAATPAAAPAAPAAPGAVGSPLAGTVVSIEVAVGQVVKSGETLLVLEAMKMNTTVGAPRDGTVTAINVAAGATVTEGQALVTLS